MQQPNTQDLVKLSDADDLHVVEGNDDVRGWDVSVQGGEKVGKVKDLLIDRGAMRARYLDIEAGGGIFGGGRRVLVPVGMVRLANDDDLVLLQLDEAQLRAYPEYDGSAVTREYEQSLRSSYAAGGATTPQTMTTSTASAGSTPATDASDWYAGQHFEEQGLYGSRRDQPIRADQTPSAGSNDASTFGTRRAASGDTYLRRPVDGGGVMPSASGTPDDVALHRRPVAADSVDHASDRVADTIDDVKDRIDGNPASRPGRDATDRPER